MAIFKCIKGYLVNVVVLGVVTIAATANAQSTNYSSGYDLNSLLGSGTSGSSTTNTSSPISSLINSPSSPTSASTPTSNITNPFASPSTGSTANNAANAANAAASSSGTVSNPTYNGSNLLYLQGDTLYNSDGITTTISNPGAYYLAGTNIIVTQAAGYSPTTTYQVSTTPGPGTTTVPGSPFYTPTPSPVYNSGGATGTYGNTSATTGIGTINPGTLIPTPTAQQSVTPSMVVSQRCLSPVFGNTNFYSGIIPGIGAMPYYPSGGSVYAGYMPQMGALTIP